MNCQKDKNLKSCPCTYPDCSRKGVCCECVLYHRKRKELPACYFSPAAEQSFDRSIKKFLAEGGRN